MKLEIPDTSADFKLEWILPVWQRSDNTDEVINQVASLCNDYETHEALQGLGGCTSPEVWMQEQSDLNKILLTEFIKFHKLGYSAYDFMFIVHKALLDVRTDLALGEIDA